MELGKARLRPSLPITLAKRVSLNKIFLIRDIQVSVTSYIQVLVDVDGNMRILLMQIVGVSITRSVDAPKNIEKV